MEDWLDECLGGTVDLSLPNLVLGLEGQPRFRGSGQLACRLESGIRVRAVTGGSELLRPTLFELPTPGRLIPSDEYLILSGESQDGWEVTTEPVPARPAQIRLDSPNVIWDFNIRWLRLSRAVTYASRPRFIRALLGPPPNVWPRPTETEVHNEYFGAKSWRTDWMLAKTAFGSLAARHRSAQWFEVRVNPDHCPADTDAFGLVNAVARAFGFILGRQVFVAAYEELLPDHESRYFWANRQAPGNRLPGPLGGQTMLYLSSAETLLGNAVDFFLTDLGDKVGEYLFLCWDTADTTMSTQVAVAGICVEGLLRLASRKQAVGDQSYTESDRKTLNDWLTAKAADLSPRFVKRVAGFIAALGHRRPVDVLDDWRKRGLLGITQGDIAAWGRTRNAAAHAGLVGPMQSRDELQRLVHDHWRVLNLMNRVILQLIGYHGIYADYSQGGAREIQFPLASSDQL